MSYLTEVAANLESEVYDYHLPHTKTIDLIGEEFAPRKHNVIVESLGSTTVTSSMASTTSGPTQNFGPNVVFVNANGTSSMPIQVQQLIQQAQQQASGGGSNGNILSVALAPSSSQSGGGQLVTTSGVPHTFTLAPLSQSAVVSSSTLVSLIQQPHITTQGNHDGLSFTNSGLTTSSGSGATLLTTSLPFNPVTVDLPPGLTSSLTGEESGVLLCNLDDLSKYEDEATLYKYIPENFYSDLCIDQSNGQAIPISHQVVVSMPDFLQTVMSGSKSAATYTVAGTHVTTTASTQGLQLQTCGMTSSSSGTSNLTQIHGSSGNQPITIQLPTQPQPLQAVKTVTYVSSPRNHGTSLTSSLQPVKLAYTTSGERIAIQGFSDSGKHGNFQFQMKPQTLFQVDPSKLTLLQEIPDLGKVVIQDARQHCDSIANILEEMKSESDSSVGHGQSGIEVTTAIPVAVSSLPNDPKKTMIKRVAAPASTVILPNKRSRNIIFTGNTLPQGAIPIQINGVNGLPISAVKSLPATINLSHLTPTSVPMMTTSSQMVAARKTRVEVVTPQRIQHVQGPPTALQAASIINKLTHNNNNQTIQFQKAPQTITMSLPTKSTPSPSPASTSSPSPARQVNNLNSAIQKAIGNNKTCTWVFENGETCGKVFSKSYNLVVHMRMHEDVRPFSCSLCDQTFRQKAHLQRHETTHGLGTKVQRPANTNYSNSKRKRKRSRGNSSQVQQSSLVVVTSGGGQVSTLSGNIVLPNTPIAPNVLSANLQRRLAHVNEKFGVVSNDDDEEDEDEDSDSQDDGQMCVMSGNNMVKHRYITLNGKQVNLDDLEHDSKNVTQIISYRPDILEHAETSKLESSFVEVQDEVGDLQDDELMEQELHHQSQPISLSNENGTIHIIVPNGGGSIPTTLADMVSRINASGQTILLQQSGQSGNEMKDHVSLDDQHVVVSTSGDQMTHGEDTIVIRNLEDHSPEIQKEILNALLNHPDNRNDNNPDSTRSMRLFIEQARQEDEKPLSDVKTEPDSPSQDLSPQSLAQDSSSHNLDLKEEESMDFSFDKSH